MKVILNKDLAPLGEEGDVKEVAAGYARNFLFPRNIALPYTERVIKLFEARKSEIEARKEEKRKAALGIKERLEGMELKLVMPAGLNGKLYGAVTNLTLAEEFAKQGFEIERKKIEIPGNNIKSTGRYKVIVKLYGASSAEVGVLVEAAETKEESAAAEKAKRKRREKGEGVQTEGAVNAEGAAQSEGGAAGEGAAASESTAQGESTAREGAEAEDGALSE